MNILGAAVFEVKPPTVPSQPLPFRQQSIGVANSIASIRGRLPFDTQREFQPCGGLEAANRRSNDLMSERHNVGAFGVALVNRCRFAYYSLWLEYLDQVPRLRRLLRETSVSLGLLFHSNC